VSCGGVFVVTPHVFCVEYHIQIRDKKTQITKRHAERSQTVASRPAKEKREGKEKKSPVR
jgi:hypothetical protein